MNRINIGDRIVGFTDLTDVHLRQLSGKITRLHDKLKQGIAVPSRGFVIFWVVIEEIIQHNQQSGNIQVESIPQKIQEELLAAYRQFRFKELGIRVAVRGALSVEDQSRAAWAGGSESPTDIIGEEDFLGAVVVCINVTFSDRMANYERRMNINSSKELSILVHEMAKTDRFAIVFTSNPLNGSRDQVIIQSTFGGGQLLTSGEETGDLFTLDRSGRLLEAVVHEKKNWVSGGVVTEMPGSKRNSQSLTDQQLTALVKFALEVEAAEDGIPQDCEVAIGVERGQTTFTLVQNRPITTEVDSLSLTRHAVITETSKLVDRSFNGLRQLGLEPVFDVYSDQNIAELLTQHPTRFSFGLFTYIFAHGNAGIKIGRNLMGYDIGDELNDGFFELIGGQPRVSIIKDALTYRLAGIPLTDYFEGFCTHYLEKIRQDEQLANYPEVILYQQNPTLEELTEMFGQDKAEHYYRLYQSFFAGIRTLEKWFADEFVNVYEPALVSYVKNQQELDLSTLSIDDLVDLIYANLDYLRTEVCVWFVIVARLGFFAYARLHHDLEDRYDVVDARQLLDGLTSGLEDDPTIEFNIALAEMEKGKLSQQTVLVRFGHLGFNELEVSGPRYHEMPTILETLAKQISSDPDKELRKRKAEFYRARERYLADASDTGHRRELEQDVESARRYLALRERVKYGYLRVYDLVRRQLLCLEKILGWSEGDIFYLDPRELIMLKTKPEEAEELVNQRKLEREQVCRLEIPQVIFTDNLDEIGKLEIPESASELVGIGVSSFVVEGPAVVVLDPNDSQAIEQIADGSVLVAPTADPTWAPLIGTVGKGGLVTEVGGPLAHGAIIARELGVAAVVNVKHATKIIKTGQRVHVDGIAGRVYIIDE